MIFPYKLDHTIKRKHVSGGFSVEILYPGLALDNGDSGVGAIGRIDQARITSGTIVKMHPHRDDEILTYLRRGRVRHFDTVGNREEISSKRLMLMNAGDQFQHEEHVLEEGSPLEGLQIFMRPREQNLHPLVQFHELSDAISPNAWRLIAGPEQSEAPLKFRAPAWVHDMRLSAGIISELPSSPAKNAARLLYVFDGKVLVEGAELERGDSLLLESGTVKAYSQDDADLVLFTTDLALPVFTGGMFSGNITSVQRTSEKK